MTDVTQLATDSPKRLGRRWLDLLLAAVLLGGLPGCFIEATAGLAKVSGANDPHWRSAPTFGLSAGVAYDARGVTRLSAGAGVQSVRTPVNGADNYISAGPIVTRLDVGAPFSRRASLRFAAAVAWGGGWRFRTSPTGGNTEARELEKAVGVFLGPALSVDLGLPRLDIAVGPAALFAWDTEGISNSQAWGGEVHVTLSIPLSYEDGLLIGASVDSALDFASSKAVIDEANRRRDEDRKASLAHGQADIEQMQRDNAKNAPPPPSPETGNCPPGSHVIAGGVCGRN